MVGYITRIGMESVAKSAQSWKNVCGMGGSDGRWEEEGRPQEG